MVKPTAADLASAAIAWIRAEDEYEEFMEETEDFDSDEERRLADVANDAYLIMENVARLLADE